jgi:hypothetical protein
MTNNPNSRFPNLGKLSVAILEHAIEPVIGKDAQEILKSPLIEKELQEKLSRALELSEQRFIKEFSDKDLTQAILDLPIANLPSLQSALRTFYDHPTDTSLYEVIQNQLSNDYSKNVDSIRIESATRIYISILREELIPISSDIREKLSSLALFGIQESTAQTQENTSKIYELLRSSNVQNLREKDILGIPRPNYERPSLYSSKSYPLIIDASSIFDSAIADIEKKLGQPIDVESMGIGELEEIPNGGQSRVYRLGNYTFYVNYDKKGIALGLQILGGLVEQKYSLDDWPIIFIRLGVMVTKSPDVVAPAARRWTNYLGYGMWITMNKRMVAFD